MWSGWSSAKRRRSRSATSRGTSGGTSISTTPRGARWSSATTSTETPSRTGAAYSRRRRIKPHTAAFPATRRLFHVNPGEVLEPALRADETLDVLGHRPRITVVDDEQPHRLLY